MPIVFHVYENHLTQDYTQEWQLRMGHYAINYYSSSDITAAEAHCKIIEITSAMGYITSITNMNSMTPQLTYQEEF